MFASSRDKDYTGMLRLLLPKFDQIVVTKYVNNPRAVEPNELLELANSLAAELALANKQIEIAAEPRAAWQRVQSAAKSEDLVCITGSFFLAAELRAIVR